MRLSRATSVGCGGRGHRPLPDPRPADWRRFPDCCEFGRRRESSGDDGDSLDANHTRAPSQRDFSVRCQLLKIKADRHLRLDYWARRPIESFSASGIFLNLFLNAEQSGEPDGRLGWRC